MSKAEGERSEATEERPGPSAADRGEAAGGSQPSSPRRDLTLYLFGRTGREKEEWFRRILLASKPKAEMKRSSSIWGSRSGKPGRLSVHNCSLAMQCISFQIKPRRPYSMFRQKALA